MWQTGGIFLDKGLKAVSLALANHWTTREVPRLTLYEIILLLLSHFSRVRLCVTPETAAHQAPPSLGFSRQEHWSGLPLPSPTQESESEVAQSCPTPRDPMDCSLPGSFAHGIFQASVLEWVYPEKTIIQTDTCTLIFTAKMVEAI